MPIYAPLIYGKRERANLTPAQRKAVKVAVSPDEIQNARKQLGPDSTPIGVDSCQRS
jgi:hypothetical protein